MTRLKPSWHWPKNSRPLIEEVIAEASGEMKSKAQLALKQL
jgi:hypothetical protein